MEIEIPLSDEERAAIQEETTKDYLEAEKLNSKGVAGIDLSAIKCPIQRENTRIYLDAARKKHKKISIASNYKATQIIDKAVCTKIE